jgi:preprotein translocase subunit YajC
MFISSAYAQGLGDMLSGAGGVAQFLPLVMIFGVFYFLLIRPQQQKQKETRAMIAAVRRGDRVVTGGGILGVVNRVPMVQDKDGNQVPSQEIEVEIAKDIRVMVLRDTITTVIKPVAANDTKPAKDRAG